MPAALRMPAYRDLRPLRLVAQNEPLPSFAGILVDEVVEQLCQAIVDAVRRIDVDPWTAVDPVNYLETSVLVARGRIGVVRADLRKSWRVRVHQADDMIAEPRRLLLHELIESGC